ncbi:MAG: DUF411 domain-containing protein [Burkholderiales bacterium]
MIPGRRRLLAALAAAAVLPRTGAAHAAGTAEVWKSPTCGCCTKWVKHLEAHGFRVRVHDVGNNAARARLRIPKELGSCHTALIAGYAIEGHVPAADILRLIKERPAAIGLAVPGMPLGSPGMEMEDGRRDRYNVLLVNRNGSTRVFSTHV